MVPIEIYVRVKDLDSLVKVELIPEEKARVHDILWESVGEYHIEAFQCGTYPSSCSIEKDPRILNPKQELTLLILDSINKMNIQPVRFSSR